MRYAVGDRVLYDENPGTIAKQVLHKQNEMYVIDWDNGARTTVWGSDLLPEMEL